MECPQGAYAAQLSTASKRKKKKAGEVRYIGFTATRTIKKSKISSRTHRVGRRQAISRKKGHCGERPSNWPKLKAMARSLREVWTKKGPAPVLVKNEIGRHGYKQVGPGFSAGKTLSCPSSVSTRPERAYQRGDHRFANLVPIVQQALRCAAVSSRPIQLQQSWTASFPSRRSKPTATAKFEGLQTPTIRWLRPNPTPPTIPSGSGSLNR